MSEAKIDPKKTKAPSTPVDADEDFLSYADKITIEDRAFGPQYPIVQWVNGNPQLKKEGGIAYTGGWFCSNEQNVEIPGATPMTWVTSNGDEIEGVGIRDLTFAVIRMRKCWTANIDGLQYKFSNDEYDTAIEYDENARGLDHLLVVPKGMTEPIVLTSKGFVGKALVSAGQKDRGIVPRFGQKIQSAATRMSGEGGKKTRVFPLCAFWMTVGPARKSNGEPEWTEVGSEQKKNVNLPVWLDEPKTVDKAEINRRFVGGAVFARHQAIFQQAEDWSKAWTSEILAPSRDRRLGGKDNGVATAQAGAGGTGAVPGENEVGF